MAVWINWIETLIVAAVSAISCRFFLHMFQLESYQLDGYERWLHKNRDALLGSAMTLGVMATIVKFVLNLVLMLFLGSEWSQVTSSVLVVAGFTAVAYALFKAQYKVPEKKPLAFTPRMKRLCACVAVLALLLASLITFLGFPPYIIFVVLAYLVLAAGSAMQPIEKAINNYYLSDAKRKLSGRSDLIKIGITGSYGKTSTKFILAAILSERFDVLASPSSFNTPMGLTRVIRNQLEQHHQVLIAEMGARHVGDIKELVELVHPQYGAITSVGPQHLETFGDVDTVASTKYELIEGLPQDGAAFFAADGAHVDALLNKCKIEKYRTGLGGGYLNMYAENIKVEVDGSHFTLCSSEGERVECHTRMLGKHNIANIVLACMIAKRLGMRMDEIANGVNKTAPVEHRLELMQNANGITVIDDAFNSNPVGAKAALDVLREFPGRRVIVTPGMVEQGENEKEVNWNFGCQMVGCCDVIILVGKKRTQPIADGALSAGFDANVLYPVDSLQDATQLIAHIGRPGDVVLFENDLPDNYR